MVEVCIFKIEGGHPKYLLLKRSKHEKIYPELWQFVTGSIEGNEKAVDAAYRELEEETGLKPKAFWVVPYVNSFYDPGWDSLNFMPVFAAELHSDAAPRLSAEHDEFGWYSYDKAFQMLVWPGQREGLRIVHDYIVKGEKVATLKRLK